MLKFQCSQCGQQLECEEQWGGQQIQCPYCSTGLIAPQAASAPAAARPKLSAGVTQVPHTRGPGPSPVPRRLPSPPRTQNPFIKLVVVVGLVLVLAWAAITFGPAFLGQVREAGITKSPSGGGVQAGPMGEVNGAMDVSDALDGNSAPAPRGGAARAAGTNNSAGKTPGRGK